MRPGDLIADRFVVDRLAGAGSMGAVYRALDRHTGQIVAIKTLQKSAQSARFAREARVLSELQHPAIVRYVAHGTTGAGDSYLAMEWLDGIDLAARLDRGPLGIRDSITLSLRVAAALGAAHARGIVHRDIKPSNLFLPDSDITRIKVLDFGIARFGGAISATRTGAVIGTPAYMAPEQASSDHQIDARADVFALGCVLFECLTGRPPFVAEHVIAVLAKVLHEEAPRARELCRDVSPELDDLLARMLAKKRDSRPADGAAVVQALEALGTLADREHGESVESQSALTSWEQRVFCVVLAETTGLRLLHTPESPRSQTLGTGMRLGAMGPRPPSSVNAPSLQMLTESELHRFAEATDRGSWHSIDEADSYTGHPSSAGSSMRIEDAAFNAVRTATASFGAKAEWLMDGSLLATLSGKGSATDQAIQAARCALSLRTLLPDAPMALAMGRGAVAGRWPVGEVIDRAASLLRRRERSAEQPSSTPSPASTDKPDTDLLPIRVDDVTAGLLDLRFNVRGDPSGLLLCGEREMITASRTLLGKPVLCVGRERELSGLMGHWEECISEPMARAVLITAPAGVGKSRLRAEFLHKLDQEGNRYELLLSFGDPMSAGSPFGMIAPAIRRTLGVRAGEPLNVRQQKLRARLGRNLSGKDLARVIEFLGELVGCPFPDDDSVELRAARQDPMLMGDQMRRAWEDFLAAECSERPVLMVFENLNWGDLPSIKFIDGALRNLADCPLFVLALARPDVQETFPRLWEDRGVHQVRLTEFTKKTSEKLVRQILGPDIDADIVERIVTQAAGNAFYLEELIRAVASGKGSQLPETVLAMVEARLETLDADARRILRAASIFGQTFWLDGILALLGGSKDQPRTLEWLNMLERLEIIASRGEGKFPGQVEYGFSSLLLREAAYAMLTPSDRELGHRLAGTWLEEAGETDAAVLAEHFERGNEPHHAIAWYRNAAEQALEGNDFVAATARAERAIICGAEGETLGVLRLLQAEAQQWRGDNAQALQCCLSAMESLAPRSALWFAVAAEIATAAGKLGQIDRLTALADTFLTSSGPQMQGGAEAIALCRLAVQLLYTGRYDLAGALLARVEEAESRYAPRDPIVMARIHQARSVAALYADDPVAHLRWTEGSLSSFERAGDVRNACLQKSNIANANMQLGAYEEAESALREALTMAERMGLSFIATVARHNLGFALAGCGALDEACAVERQAMNDAMAQGDIRLQAATKLYLALILTEKGELPEAESMIRACLSTASRIQPLMAYGHGVLARILLAQGRGTEAMAASEISMNILNELGKIEAGEALLRLTYAECLYAMRDVEVAHQAIRSAREKLLQRVARISEPQFRQSFLVRIREHAATFAHAQSWAGEDSRPWASPTAPGE